MATPKPATPLTRVGDFFAIRTPLLPYDALEQWTEGLEAPAACKEGGDLEAALAADKARLRERLRQLIQRPEVREALYLASPDLEESLDRWSREPDSEKGQRTETALVRYLQRMAHRCTPFGLFAGHGTGRMGETTRLSVPPQEVCTRHTRLDMDYLCGLVTHLDRDPGLRDTLVYRPNTSLYRHAGRLRYAETRPSERGRDFKLVAVKENPYLRTVLDRAEGGARLGDLAAALVAQDIPQEDAEAFLQELVDNQLLVSDLEPALTGPEPTLPLAEVLSRHEGTRPLADRLLDTARLLTRLDEGGLGHAPEVYRDLAQDLAELPAKVDLSKLLQVDLHKPSPDATLGPEVLAELEKGADLLYRLTPKPSGDALSGFREAFTKRYESRWVPLVEALDPESGIGFSGTVGQKAEAAPLLEGLPFAGRGGAGSRGGGLSRREVHLLKHLQKRRPEDGLVWDLGEEDLRALQENPGLPLPDSMAAMVVLAAPSSEAISEGRFQLYLEGLSGPSGVRLLGRFCHGDETLTEAVRRHIREEEAYRPDCAYAELVHLSQERMGNVLARPLLRDYEIPFLGRSGADDEATLPITDLLVSVRGNQVLLHSRRLGREVIPRLTSAANFHYRAMDLYRFLGTLQGQSILGSPGWTWGALGSEPFLPRITHGRLVLFRARWNVSSRELKPLVESEGAERYRRAQALREARAFPRVMLLADGDNELPVDWENPLSLEAFCAVVKKRGAIQLVEDAPGEDELPAAGPEGRYTHELLVPLLRRAPAPTPTPGAKAPTVEAAPDRFGPGSEWLYLKLYGGQSSSDRLLAEGVAPLAARALASGDAGRWFFIRYGDPDPHLRLRFQGDPARLYGSLLPALNRHFQPFLEDGSLWRLELGTYERETSRYGGPDAIAQAESLFQLDSEAALRIVQAHPGDTGAIQRWQLALAGMDLWLRDLGYGPEEGLEVIRRAREGFAREFLSEGPLDKQLGDRFRKERRALEALLWGVPDPALAPGLEALARRSAACAPLVADLRTLEARDGLTTPWENLVQSLIHMSVNRLQRSAQRQQEFVLYDFLLRLYESRLARLRKGAEAKAPA